MGIRSDHITSDEDTLSVVQRRQADVHQNRLRNVQLGLLQSGQFQKAKAACAAEVSDDNVISAEEPALFGGSESSDDSDSRSLAGSIGALSLSDAASAGSVSSVSLPGSDAGSV